jgi:NAD(P)-dependent dehydrogenase (short-subunit alcohol dehydrogenase family)
VSSFSGKVAVVTGGASGIGRAIAQALVRRGARVIVADIDGERAREAAREIGAEAEQVDVVDPAAVEGMVDRVWRAHGGIDYMFNNAGICIVGDARKFELADYHRLIDVNVRGVINGTYAAYQRMAERGSGHIVNTASIAGLVPSPRFTGYAMTKHAVVGLSTSLRLEAARYGVRVSAVCPGVIDTPMAHNALLRGDMDRKAAIRQIPMYAPEDCAEDVLAGVEKNRPLIVVTPQAKAAFALHRFAPEWLPRMILKQMRRFER